MFMWAIAFPTGVDPRGDGQQEWTREATGNLMAVPRVGSMGNEDDGE
jgi:hypothetical protein